MKFCNIIKHKNMTDIIFSDYPEFRPNLTPYQIFSEGAFGGTYWRPIYSSVVGRQLKNQHKKYKFDISESLLSCSDYDVSKNKYGVKCGTSLEYWESKNWISEQDPYGWVQWYCEFYYGRRSDDDIRQIKRWLRFAGPKGRFLTRLKRMAGNNIDDYSISPVIRQSLHHWAKRLV
jgi:hypothetical protein